MSKLVQRQGRDDDPPRRSESSAGSRSRRKAPAGRPTRPAIRLGGGGHWRGRIGPGGGVDGHGRRYRIFCMSTCKVSGLAFVHAWEDRTAHRTAHRAGDEGPIADHHPPRASAGRAGTRWHFGVDCRGILRTVHTHHRLSAERRGQGTIQPAWGWGAAYMSGRSKPLSAAGSWSRAGPAGWSGRAQRRPDTDARNFCDHVYTRSQIISPSGQPPAHILQATVPSGTGTLTACDAGNAGHAAPSEAARYFWWRRRRWFARAVRGVRRARWRVSPMGGEYGGHATARCVPGPPPAL